MTVPPPIPPDFTIGKTNIIDARRMWHGGNKRCGAESNKTVCAYKDIPWSHLNGETLKKTRRGWGLWRRIMVPRGRAGQDPQPRTRVAQSPSDAPPHHHDARYRDPQGDVDRQTHNSAEHEFGGDG